MSQQPDLSAFDAQYQRMFEAAECKTQVALAELLGLRQSSVADAKRRRRIPADWLVTLFMKKRISPQWILYGEGARHHVPADAEYGKPQVIHVTKVRPPRECSAQELVNELVRRALESVDAGAAQEEVTDSGPR